MNEVSTFFAQTADGAGFADIREPVWFLSWALIAGIIAFWLMGILLMLLFIRSRKRRRLKAAEGPPPIPPSEWIRLEFSRLEEGGASLDDRGYSSRVSDLLRRYLELAFSLPAPERTTEEFLQIIGQHPVFGASIAAPLQRFLTRVDLVKFARQPMSPGERDQLLSEARSVVEQAEAASAEMAEQQAAAAAEAARGGTAAAKPETEKTRESR